MSSTDEQPAPASQRSSRRGSSVSSAVVSNNHPHPTPIDATTIELDVLRDSLGIKIFEERVDFVDASDEMIATLFLNDKQRADEKNTSIKYPPLTYRRTARAIREWVRMGNEQKREKKEVAELGLDEGNIILLRETLV